VADVPGASPGLARMMSEWEHVRSLVNDELNNIRNSLDVPSDLREAAFHLISAGGKRIRPFILMLSGGLFDVEYRESLPAATSVELLHNFTLIHDDIMDRDEFRRGIPTTHVKFGEEVALVAGDFLFSYLHHYLVSRYSSMGKSPKLIVDIISILSEAMNNICVGQIMDILPEKYINSVDDYLRMVYCKTAALIEASACIGGMLGGCSESELEYLRNFGKNIGMAFQIADDILGVFGDPKVTGKPVGSDIRMGKRTLIVLFAEERMGEDERRVFRRVFGNREASDRDVMKAIKIIEGLKVLDDVKAVMYKLKDKALSFLRKLPRSIYREHLECLSEYIVTRQK